MRKNLPQYTGVYPRYENPTMEFQRRKQNVRFLRQYEQYDIYVATNLTHIYGVYGEEDDQYIPVFLGFADDSETPWVREAISTLKGWGYIKEDLP